MPQPIPTPQLAYGDLYRYLMRNPQLAAQYTPLQNAQQSLQQSDLNAQPRMQAQRNSNILNEGIASVDPLFQFRIMQMLGIPLPTNMRVNQGFADAGQMQPRMNPLGAAVQNVLGR